MCSKLTTLQYKLIRKTASENGFSNFELEEIHPLSKDGNYLGEILTIIIRDQEKRLELFMKLYPQNENFRKALPVQEIFGKEVQVYETVLTHLAKFQNDLGVKNPFNSFARYYGMCEIEFNECLILENLVNKGYTLWDRRKPMNEDHISLVMSELGKFHAISYAMKTKCPQSFNEDFGFLMKPPSEFSKHNRKCFLKISIANIRQAIVGYRVLETACEKLVSQAEQFYTKDLNKNVDKMVIVHEDIWCNNILFRYTVSTDMWLFSCKFRQ